MAAQVVDQIHLDPEQAVAVHAREEFGIDLSRRPGESLGVFATDGTVEVRNASIARGLKRK
ncbi:MAG TPA: hypothetical protein PLJ01_04150 [Bifidobacterium adolescentis]|nr:hypothetical protein [Bifidobacterium adolescentis]